MHGHFRARRGKNQRWDMAIQTLSDGPSLRERLEHGNLSVRETRKLKHRSHSGFYEDVHAGKVVIEKIGRKSIVRGPIARAYIAGEPLPEK
jgi:hypothetical protein